jgi:hypothetical protein
MKRKISPSSNTRAMNNDDKYSFLALESPPARLTTSEAAWYLGFKPHEIPLLVAAGLLEPLGHPSPNTPKFFGTESLAELRNNSKWLEKATDAISAHWRRKNARRCSGRNVRPNPPLRATGV